MKKKKKKKGSRNEKGLLLVSSKISKKAEKEHTYSLEEDTPTSKRSSAS